MDTTTDPMHDESWTVEYCTNGRYTVQSKPARWGKEWRIWDTSEQVEIRADPRMLMGMTALDYLLHTAHYLNGRHAGAEGL